jgi:hypothetical protein
MGWLASAKEWWENNGKIERSRVRSPAKANFKYS